MSAFHAICHLDRPTHLQDHVELGGGDIASMADQFVSYPSGAIAWFRCQLVFSPMTVGGDSGAVIVRDDDTATRLALSGDGTETLANPIYKLVTQGIWASVNNATGLPRFTRNLPLPAPPLPTVPCSQ